MFLFPKIICPTYFMVNSSYFDNDCNFKFFQLPSLDLISTSNHEGTAREYHAKNPSILHLFESELRSLCNLSVERVEGILTLKVYQRSFSYQEYRGYAFMIPFNVILKTCQKYQRFSGILNNCL